MSPGRQPQGSPAMCQVSRQAGTELSQMNVFGVTGGIGMGKSACASLLRERGFSVVDTDDLARQIVEPGEPALGEIAKSFGQEMLDEAGRLRRELLGKRVFADASARKELEGILHPRIRSLWQQQCAAWAAEGKACGFVIIPLLFETQAERDLDYSICVACSRGTQLQRLKNRGWSSEEIRLRTESQLSVESKMMRSQFVIWTEGSFQVHAAQIDRILARYCRLAAPP